MNGKRKKNQASWHSHIEAWKSSGLPMSRYCKQHKLMVYQLGYYKRKFETAKSEEKTGRSGFVRVMPVIPVASPVDDSVTVKLSCGHTIEGASKSNLNFVVSLIEALS